MKVYTVTVFDSNGSFPPTTRCYSSERAAFAYYAYMVAEYAAAQDFEEADAIYDDLLGGDVLLAELTARQIAGDLDGVFVVHDVQIPSEAFTFEGVRYREEV